MSYTKYPAIRGQWDLDDSTCRKKKEYDFFINTSVPEKTKFELPFVRCN